MSKISIAEYQANMIIGRLIAEMVIAYAFQPTFQNMKIHSVCERE